MVHNKLTARAIATTTAKGRYGDGGGLFLQVSKWGTKSWVFRYERHGRERVMGLGPLHTLSLAEARDRARQCRQRLLEGLDPIDVRNSALAKQRVEAASKATFKECAEAFVTKHAAGWSRRNLEHWQITLRVHVYPVIGDVPVAMIDTAWVMRVVDPIWRTKPDTAKRLRARIGVVLDSATVLGFRQGDNPARWRGHLDKLLPQPNKVRAVKHLAALPHHNAPAFLAELRLRDGLGPRMLEFTILTAVRTGEVLGARWSEFDLMTSTWAIPAERMKSKAGHRVPLSPRVIEILKALPRTGEYVFPSQRDGRPFSQVVMLKTLHRMGRRDLTVHGFRSTFRDWAAETTAYPNHVVEMALAHAIGDQVEAAYRRGDLFEKRTCLMADWSAYCTQPSLDMGGVIPIRASA
jgi:integrase